jgi:hypothetical protein
MIGKARMTMKAALTFTCMNLKKLAKIKGGNPSLSGCFRRSLWALKKMFEAQNKMAPAIACLNHFVYDLKAFKIKAFSIFGGVQ